METSVTSTVWAIIDLIVPELRELNPDVNRMHFWTDSPTSQYRNKHIFYLVVHFPEFYHVQATWSYFEAGRGKGPCDGLGGTTKRMADEASRSGNASIQDAREFYSWAKSSTMHGVTFLWLDSSVCREKLGLTTKLLINPIKGTMKIHTVTSTDADLLLTRDKCLNGSVCESWKQYPLKAKGDESRPFTKTDSTENLVMKSMIFRIHIVPMVA